MANGARGEAEIVLAGERRVMRLTLGALAGLEAELEAGGLMALAERFESGRFAARDLIALLGAGLRGGGTEISDAALAEMEIEGGAAGAARAAVGLLKATFAPLDDG